MGEFLKLAQSDEIDGPRRTKFTTKKWKAAFDEVPSPDLADQRLYESALAVHSKLSNVRNQLKLSTTKTLTTPEKVRAFVAAANYGSLIAQEKTRTALAETENELSRHNPDGIRAEDVIAEIKIELPGGYDWSPNEVAESLVEGIEIPLKFALKSDSDLSGNPRMVNVRWEDIISELNLGIIYCHTEDIWNDCLWNGYFSLDVKDRKIFLPEDLAVRQAYAVGIARRNQLSTAFSIQAVMKHRDYIAQGATMRIRDVKSVEKRGKKQTIKLKKLEDSSLAQETQIVLRFLANEPYYKELLDLDLPSLDGVTLNEVLDVWVVVSRTTQVLADAISGRQQSNSDINDPTLGRLTEFCPILQTEALVQAVMHATGIIPGKSRKIINFLTFFGNSGQEIWDSPLIPAGLKVVAPVFIAAINPNLRRLVDVWMRRGGIDLEARGGPFEAHIRAKMVSAIGRSPVLAKTAICVPNDFEFKPTTGRSEQIDLVVVIGSTVLVGESKCILEPTDAKAIAMHRRTVLGAAAQASRKANALANNKGEFVAAAAKMGIQIGEDFRVVPLVIVSTSTHVGVPANGVPVVDEYILAKFLEGSLEDAGVDMSSLTVSARSTRTFYADATEAENVVNSYLNSPPQIQHLQSGTKARVIPLHAISEEDWEGFLLTLECSPKNSAPAIKKLN